MFRLFVGVRRACVHFHGLKTGARALSKVDITHGRSDAREFNFTSENPLQIDHADEHGAARIERQVLESPTCVEPAHTVIERMRDDAHAADDFGGVQSRFEREQKQGRGMSLSLIILVDGEFDRAA